MTTRCRSLLLCSAGLLATAACDDARTAGRDSTVAGAPTTAAAATPALVDAPDRSLQRGAVTINYRVIGEGEPVLLVHGYGDRLQMWAGLADSLARDHRVIALDTRAFGKSSKPAGAASYGVAMLDDLVALLDRERIPSAHVVGYSMGAMLGASLAARAPDRVRSATLVGGGYFPDEAASRRFIAPFVADLQQGRRLEGLLRFVVPTLPDSEVTAFSDQLFAESDSAALLGALQSFPALSVDWAKASDSRVPLVAIAGGDDPLLGYSKYIVGRWPGARLVEVPGTDHVTIIAAPALLREVRATTRGGGAR